MNVCPKYVFYHSCWFCEERADSSMCSVCQPGNLITCQFYSGWKCNQWGAAIFSWKKEIKSHNISDSKAVSRIIEWTLSGLCENYFVWEFFENFILRTVFKALYFNVLMTLALALSLLASVSSNILCTNLENAIFSPLSYLMVEIINCILIIWMKNKKWKQY